jgi:penicillin G amidase
MLTAFRWLIRLVAGAIVLGLVAMVLAYWILSRSLVDYSEDFEVSGISAPVEIVRNNDNVPHIFGARPTRMCSLRLGFAHAQDRLWQMTMLRRTAQGRLSEIFGQPTVRVDELMRRLDLYGLALQSVEAQDAETKAALEAYAAGVNAWIGEINAGARGGVRRSSSCSHPRSRPGPRRIPLRS